MKLHKKGVIDQLTAMIIPVLVIAIVLVVGFLILAEAKGQIETIEGVNATGHNAVGDDNFTSAAWNATGVVQVALSDIPGWLPIIIITIIGALLISLVSVFRRR